jgi:hypothetical protein
MRFAGVRILAGLTLDVACAHHEHRLQAAHVRERIASEGNDVRGLARLRRADFSRQSQQLGR